MEIKYRVWCVNKKEWEKHRCLLDREGLLFQDVGGPFVRLQPCGADTHIVSFFTGVLDKNGVGIFEDDVIRATNEHNDDSNEFVVHMPDHMLVPDVYIYEVVRNIYEQPETVDDFK